MLSAVPKMKRCTGIIKNLHVGFSNLQGMEGSGEPVSPFDSYVDLNPQASMVEGPRISAANAIPEHHGGTSVTSAPARMASLEDSMSPHASPSSTGETPPFCSLGTETL